MATGARSGTSASRSPTAATSAASTACRPRGCRGSGGAPRPPPRRCRASARRLACGECARLAALRSWGGVHDVRLAGGEPLVRRELWRLVEMLSGIEAVHDLSLTTNGYLLARQVDDLVRAGLKRINVSLDSLAPDRFFQLTRRDSLAQVLEGLEAAEAHPELRPIKVNVVALKDFTEDNAVRFAEFARRTPFVVRFVAFMPVTPHRSGGPNKVLQNVEIRRLIRAAYPLDPLGRDRPGT